MVTKTISIDDELFVKIKDSENESTIPFSKICNQLIKLGFAYQEILRLEAERRNAKM